MTFQRKVFVANWFSKGEQFSPRHLAKDCPDAVSDIKLMSSESIRLAFSAFGSDNILLLHEGVLFHSLDFLHHLILRHAAISLHSFTSVLVRILDVGETKRSSTIHVTSKFGDSSFSIVR